MLTDEIKNHIREINENHPLIIVHVGGFCRTPRTFHTEDGDIHVQWITSGFLGGGVYRKEWFIVKTGMKTQRVEKIDDAWKAIYPALCEKYNETPIKEN